MLRVPLLLLLAACPDSDGPGVDSDSGADTDIAPDTGPDTDSGTDTGATSEQWFQAMSTGEIHFAAACSFDDPTSGDAGELGVVGWFDGSATFGAGSASETTAVADGVDGFFAVLDTSYALERLVVLGGPGDQRAEDCGGDSLAVVGRFGGELSVTGLEARFTATSPADVFLYHEQVEARPHGNAWTAGMEHVVAGEVASVIVAGHPWAPRVAGTFEGDIEVFPGTPEAWTATSAGGLDGFYARPTTPFLVAGPGRETLTHLFTWFAIAGWGSEGTRLAGAASEGASIVNGASVTPIPATSGAADALYAWNDAWSEDTVADFTVAARGGPGDDELRVYDYVYDSRQLGFTGNYLIATFDSGAPSATTRWGTLDLVGMGGVDVVLHHEASDGSGVEQALVLGSPGDDSLTHALHHLGYLHGAYWLTGGIVSGQFAEGAFTAPGLAPVAACGASTPWVVEFVYEVDTGFQPTWLGGGCALTLGEVSLGEDGGGDGVAFVLADHDAGAWLDLPTRTVRPPDPPAGGSGAFVASWGP